VAFICRISAEVRSDFAEAFLQIHIGLSVFINDCELKVAHSEASTPDAAKRSGKAVYAAIAGNAAVAVSKITAAFLTGSSAMFAEAVHSLADLADDSLLAYGRARSRRPPDADHPFGHGQEAYFWNFLLAILVFGVGAVFAFYKGAVQISHPARLESALWNYVVLALSAVFEGASLAVGYREFRSLEAGRPLFKALHVSKNPPVFSVVLEDIAALIGIAIAATGIWQAHWLQQPRIDGSHRC
jgi:divalent metal cation (Fe/Co/Zn/Cd) transporter